MCLIVVAFNAHPDYPLIIAGNRDEFHSRPSREAHWWPDRSDIVGGRDLLAGGTWLALHRGGRFAAVTNFRDAEQKSAKLRSRGHLVTGFLEHESRPQDYLKTIGESEYAGFNLLAADRGQLGYLSNRGGGLRDLPVGIYGLSNATLDTPWEKVERTKAALLALIDADTINATSLLRLLGDREKGPIDQAESGRLPFATAHAITAPFIVLPDYGTRCSSIVIADSEGQWRFIERRFDPTGRVTGESQFSFRVGENVL